MTPIQFYRIFTKQEGWYWSNEFSDLEESQRTKYHLSLQIDEIVRSLTPRSLRVFIEELEEIRERDYYEKDFNGEFQPPQMGYKYWQILEEYGVNIYSSEHEYKKPTVENYQPAPNYFWAVEELRRVLEKLDSPSDHPQTLLESSEDDSAHNSPPSPDSWELPNELATDRARKYFARCIDEGWLTVTHTGGEWKLQGVRLGYICNRIYEQPRPLTALIKFFNNPNLKAQITQADYEAKTTAVKKWRKDIDTKIFFD